jgi:hypothetical protein
MQKDVLQILTETHAMLGWLAERLQAARPGRSRAILFNEVARSLGAHQTVIDRTILPALKQGGWRGVSSDVLAGHMALKRALAETLTLRDRAAFDAAIPWLAARLRVQCRLEQEKLVPLLRCFDDDERIVMAQDAELHLTRLLGDKRHPPDDGEVTPQAEELVEEAYVVLRSLPQKDEHTDTTR